MVLKHKGLILTTILIFIMLFLQGLIEINLIFNKIRYKIFFLSQDTNLWDMISNSYTHSLDVNGIRIKSDEMNMKQIKDHINHHECSLHVKTKE